MNNSQEIQQILNKYEEHIKGLVLFFKQIMHQNARKDEEVIKSRLMEIIYLDAQLQTTVKKLEQHYKRQQHLKLLTKDLEQHDSLLHSFVVELRKIEQELLGIVELSNAKLKIIENSQKTAVSPQTLISFAQKIAYTTSAPPPTSGNVGVAKPPVPIEEQMRSGALIEKSRSASKKVDQFLED